MKNEHDHEKTEDVIMGSQRPFYLADLGGLFCGCRLDWLSGSLGGGFQYGMGV